MQVTFLGCVFDENLSREPMSLKALIKISEKQEFSYRENEFLNQRSAESNAMLTSGDDLIMPALHGTLTSMKN